MNISEEEYDAIDAYWKNVKKEEEEKWKSHVEWD